MGRFNEVIADFALGPWLQLPGEKRIWAVGERVYAHLGDAGVTLAGQFPVPASVTAITPLIGEIQSAYERYRPAEIICSSMSFTTALNPPRATNLRPRGCCHWMHNGASNSRKSHGRTKNLPQVIGARSRALRSPRS